MLYDAFMMLYVWHILTPRTASSYTKTDTYLDWDSIPTEANFYAPLGCAHGIVGLLAERGRPGKHQGPRSFWPRWCWSLMIYLAKIAKSSDWWIFWVAIFADTNIPRYQDTKIQDTGYPFSTVGCRLWYVPVDSQVIISAVGVSAIFTGGDHSQKICWCSL